MSDRITITIDGKACQGTPETTILNIARENGIYIPSLCSIPGIHPHGSCRICNVKVNGRFLTACTTAATDGMVVESELPEINLKRKMIVELLFVEGNHFCPACEKSGNCELQALAYRFQMTHPRYPFNFPVRRVAPTGGRLLLEHNRCVLCKRCVRGLQDSRGRNTFAFYRRGRYTEVQVDEHILREMSEEELQHAMNICPVGAILVKEQGFRMPLGTRKYDHSPIGSDLTQP